MGGKQEKIKKDEVFLYLPHFGTFLPLLFHRKVLNYFFFKHLKIHAQDRLDEQDCIRITS